MADTLITLRILEADLETFTRGFLVISPVPMENVAPPPPPPPDPPFPPDMQPTMTVKQWITHCAEYCLQERSNEGLKLLEAQIVERKKTITGE